MNFIKKQLKEKERNNSMNFIIVHLNFLFLKYFFFNYFLYLR